MQDDKFEDIKNTNNYFKNYEDIEEKKEEKIQNKNINKEEITNKEEILNEEEILNNIEELKKKNDDLTNKLQRNLAEFDNFRKRTIKEKASIYDDGVKDTVERFLSIIDNFERALVSIEDKDSNIYKGLQMVYKQFENTLIDIGVDNIKCIGENFDPKFHFAVSHEKDDSYGQNEIIEELQKGYKYKDKVIRCSMVKVAN